MIYQPPHLQQIDQDVLGLLHKQRSELRYLVDQNPIRWRGTLRRNTFARAVQGSNSIEGFNANLADAVAIIDDEKPDTVQDETIKALVGYRTAMTYILTVHDDPHSTFNEQLIRSLHFMMLSYDMTKLPGQWRRGPIFVAKEDTGERVYEAPPAELIPELMNAYVQQLTNSGDQDGLITAALAHLNLTMIHPFKDGNGRMARAVQTLLLTKDGLLSPIFSSIEEWLGRNTQSYYDILAHTGRGQWSPHNSALPWVRFCLHAHYQQAATLIRRNGEIALVWEHITTLAKEHGLNERLETPLVDAALGYRVRNHKYRSDANLSDVVASRDLKRLCELDLLLAVGEKRGRYYLATDKLKAIRQQFRQSQQSRNPYEIAGWKNDNSRFPFPLT
jgi:Fic family protein